MRTVGVRDFLLESTILKDDFGIAIPAGTVAVGSEY
jgi:hypothetical protein